ncbi:hypothetical protein [Kitasatospora sp. NPDC056531]|uniref:hypothetical protein n=1 Tax=Kitasatospora sp. NPDC056531 TaxID=3345856 RepID=UPI0036C8B28F
MSRTARLRLFLTAAAVLAAALIAAATELPGFGGVRHPYGERAVTAGLAQRTADIVSSVNFDQRAFDTLGEESILFGSVLGSGMLPSTTACSPPCCCSSRPGCTASRSPATSSTPSCSSN